jgi:ABC-type transport system involved in multi-copper enzyme maturation permease subunit
MITELKMLIWKDYRLSRLCMGAGIIFTVMPYLFFFYPYIQWDYNHAWMTSALVSQFTMALMAGNIIASERADRSAAFLVYQGATRKKVVASKLIICTMAFLSICTISFILSFWLTLRPQETKDLSTVHPFCASIGLCFFGCCWLLSAILTSAVSSIVLGFLVPFIIGLILNVTNENLHWLDYNSYPYWYIGVASATGLISLVVGTWCFLRRKES